MKDLIQSVYIEHKTFDKLINRAALSSQEYMVYQKLTNRGANETCSCEWSIYLTTNEPSVLYKLSSRLETILADEKRTIRTVSLKQNRNLTDKVMAFCNV